MPRRKVRRSAGFLDQAYRLFPPERSEEGRASFQDFERGPLRGAETAFSLNFEAQRQPIEGVASIRYVTVPPTPAFGPIVIFACLLSDGTIELVSVIHDEGYWERIGDDPFD
ncbi:MAG: hypothetical protein M3203_03315 [Actinomycetota bacterium]|nr:hypothetical protein [Actinomycetota bacterium]